MPRQQKRLSVDCIMMLCASAMNGGFKKTCVFVTRSTISSPHLQVARVAERSKKRESPPHLKKKPLRPPTRKRLKRRKGFSVGCCRFDADYKKLTPQVCHPEPPSTGSGQASATLRINSTKGLTVRFFAALRMTLLSGHVVKCP